MAKAYMCDHCKKLITEDDIRITLSGYTVYQNESCGDMPQGYGIGFPEEFCSFTCLSEWAIQQQALLDDYKKLVAEKYPPPEQ